MRLNSTRESLEQRLVHHVGAEHAQLLLNATLINPLNNLKQLIRVQIGINS
jgi:hypothetical protein